MVARDPSDDWEESDSEEEGLEGAGAKVKPKKGVKIDIDLGLSAYANATRFEQQPAMPSVVGRSPCCHACRYYGHKKLAANKEQRTIDASQKVLCLDCVSAIVSVLSIL